MHRLLQPLNSNLSLVNVFWTPNYILLKKNTNLVKCSNYLFISFNISHLFRHLSSIYRVPTMGSYGRRYKDRAYSFAGDS